VIWLAEATVLSLRDLEDIGPVAEKKLVDAGIESVLELAVALPDEVSQILNIDKVKAYELIYSAQVALMDSGYLDKSLVNALDVLEKRRDMIKCTTSSKSLDSLLNVQNETI